MKMQFVGLRFALIFLCNITFAQTDSSHYKTEIDFGNGTVFSTFLKISNTHEQFTITSPEDADIRIYGGKAKLGRILGKSPKKGIIITISGKRQSDSLYGDTNIPMVGKLKFRGSLKNGVLNGALLNNDGMDIGTLRGILSAENKMDYRYLYPMLINTVENNIYSVSVLKTTDWKKFKKEIEKLCATAHDDIEMYFGFNILAQQLPFSHLNFTIGQDQEETKDVEKPEETPTATTQKSVVFEEKNSATAYLQIKNFSNSTEELAATLPQIIANPNCKNLIIDLRNNPGGGIEAAFEFSKHIIGSDMEVGYFLSNKLDYSGYQAALFKTLPELQPKGTKEFTDELKASPGVKLIFKRPDNPVFSGNIYVLTNGITASTSEPIVYTLKNRKIATIVGEKTRGAMLSAAPFVVSGKYMLILPIGDFYTYDGVRLDRVGVTPDIEVDSDNALNKVLEIINGAPVTN